MATKMNKENYKSRGAIAWMTKNPVAANILMLFLLIGGLISALNIKQEVFPEFTIDEVVITVPYPGASPEEVEQGVVLPVEEAIQDIEGIKKVTSTANEGVGSVYVEVVEPKLLNKVYDDVKNAVDRITTFAEDVEDPDIYIPSKSIRVITVLLYGNVNEKILRNYTEFIRDRLTEDPDITLTELKGTKPLEIKVELSIDKLRLYDLNISDVADVIRNTSKDIPAGSIKTKGGNILLRVKEKRYIGDEFHNIPVKTNYDGSIIYLKDIAKITDSFEEVDTFMTYNGMLAQGIDIYRVGKQTPISVANAVKKHIENLKNELPDRINIAYVDDRSEIFMQRMNLLLKNAYFGLALVFVLLALFLELRLAFWVSLGIPVSFLGAFIFLPSFDVSVNMISLFAFITALGIVVDDAIIVGENIYSYRQKGLTFFQAAIKGAKEIAVPVIFSILTNIIAFTPMLFIPGVIGKIYWNIPAVVITIFAISLIESIFILPAHIGHQKENHKNFLFRFVSKYQQKISNLLMTFIENFYGPAIKFLLKYRYVTITSGVAVLLLSLTFVKTGRLGFVLFPRVESDFSYISGTLAVDAPVTDTIKIRDYLLKVVKENVEKYGGEKLSTGVLSSVSDNTFWIQVFLTPPEVRPINTYEFTEILRKSAGNIAGLENLSFQSDRGGPGAGASLTVELSHSNTDILYEAADELANYIEEYPIASEVDNGFTPGKTQIDVKLKPLGYLLNISPNYIARELRNRYYGNEAITQQRGRNELKIRVMLDEKDRKNLAKLQHMIIKTPNESEILIRDVANLNFSKAYTVINRRDYKRIVNVTSEITPRSRTNEIMNDLKITKLPELVEKYPGLSYSFEGKEADRRESMEALTNGLYLALLGIFVVLAIPLKSYLQPLIIMTSIPFGIIGAVIGHMIMGYPLSLVSAMGIVALTGVVVNDALVLINIINQKVREERIPVYRAVVEGGIQRFRPIILTTLTTFFGLMPMIFETSRQAKFLIPMAISLGFGVLFSTMITLVLVPSLYIALEDIKHFIKRIF
jgi:multidrug efflux pump subunit AcrB